MSNERPPNFDEKVATMTEEEPPIIGLSKKSAINVDVTEVAEPLEPVSTSTPLDRGPAAYRALAGAFLIQSAIAGFPLAYGMFQEHYVSVYPASESRYASWIGVLCEGLPYLGAPIMSTAVQKLPIPRKTYLWIGYVLCILALLTSGFVKSLHFLILTQGVLFGIGAMFFEIPSLSILDSHFNKRRGMAYGLCFGGSDLFGMCYSFIASTLLEKYSLRITMLTFMSITIFVAGAGICLMKLREEGLAPSSPSAARRGSNDSFVPAPLTRARPLVEPTVILRGGVQRQYSRATSGKRYYQRSIFYILNAANFLLAVAQQLPFIYLPTFASELGYSTKMGALILAIANFGQIFGEIGMGKLSDHVNVNYLVVLTMSMVSVSTFCLWGLAGSTSLATIVVYAFLVSGFGAGFLALWARIGMLFGDQDDIMVFSILSFGRGSGSIASGPISQVLLSQGPKLALGMRHRTSWGAMIVYIGSCTALSACMGVLATVTTWFKKEKVQDSEH